MPRRRASLSATRRETRLSGWMIAMTRFAPSGGAHVLAVRDRGVGGQAGALQAGRHVMAELRARPRGRRANSQPAGAGEGLAVAQVHGPQPGSGPG